MPGRHTGSTPGSSTENTLVRALSPGQFSFLIDISSTSVSSAALVASLRRSKRTDGSTYVPVLYRLKYKQSSTSFEDLASAARFQKLVDKFGPAKALETLGTDPEFSGATVGE